MNKILDVLSGKIDGGPPFWFMRQAGRYMPEYMELRQKAGSFLNLCLNPQTAAEVTMQPIKAFDMDAAIIFADILLVPMALGIDLKFETGEGPILGEFDVENLNYDENKVSAVFEALKIVSAELPEDKGLIGFAGSPWTVSTYMIEGGSSDDYAKTKKMISSEPDKLQKIMDILVDSTTSYLIKQIDSGAQILQLFDSWSGAVQGNEFDRWVIEPNKQIVEKVKHVRPDIKIIGFPKGCAKEDLKRFCAQTGVDAISIGSEIDIGWARDNLDVVIQGNLDQNILLKSQDEISIAATNILETMHGKPFIFNLGHGINKETLPENIAFLSKLIKNYKD